MVIRTQSDTTFTPNAFGTGLSLAPSAADSNIGGHVFGVGQTAGSTEITTENTGGGSEEATVMFRTPANEPGVTTWDAGNYVCRINVTTANNRIDLKSAYIMEDNGGVYTEVASNTGNTISLGTTGTKTITVNLGSAYTASATGRIVIVFGFQSNTSHGGQTVGITPSLDIDDPLTSVLVKVVNESVSITETAFQRGVIVEVEDTIGSGLDYSTVSLWESGTSGIDQTLISTIYRGLLNDQESVSGSITISGNTVSADYYRELTFNTGKRNDFLGDTGAKLEMSTTNTFVIDEAYFRMSGICVEGDGNFLFEVDANGTNAIIDGCSIHNNATSGSPTPARSFAPGAVWQNCLIRVDQGNGDGIDIDDCEDAKSFNLSIHSVNGAAQDGYDINGGTETTETEIRNVISMNFLFDFDIDTGGASAVMSHNLSADTTATSFFGSDALDTYAVGDIWVDADNRDYSLVAACDAIDSGYDASARFTTDITGTTRTGTWDRGAFEDQSATQITKIVNETVQLSEGILDAQGLKRVLNEALQVTETVQKVGTYLRVINETVEVSEGVLRLGHLTRIVNESESISEASLKILGLIRVVNESESISEAIQKNADLRRIVDEGVSVSEALLKLGTYLRVINESVSVEEAVLRLGHLTRIVNETEQISESSVRLRGLVRVTNDTVQVSETTEDVLETSLAIVKVVNETVESSESVLDLRGLVRIVNESQSISEGVSKIMALVRIIDESESVSEATDARMALTKVLSETLDVSESISSLRGLVRIVNETEQVSEAKNYVEIPATPIFKVVNETVQVSETLVRLRAMVRVVNETVEISETADDVAIPATQITKVVDETVSVASDETGAVRVMGLIRIVNETEQVSESAVDILVTATQITKVVDETVQISDSTVKLAGLVRVVNEDVEAGETIDAPMALVRIVNEVEGVAEGTVTLRALVRVVDENVEVSESVDRAVASDLTEVVDETVQVSETVLAFTGRVILVPETVQVSESVLAMVSLAIGQWETLSNTVRGHFDDLVSEAMAVPVVYANARSTQPTTLDSWAEVAVDHEGSSEQKAFLSRSNRYRNSGVLRCRVYGSLGKGDTALRTEADKFVSAFRGLRASDVVYGSPVVSNPEFAGKHWSIEARVPFRADYTQRLSVSSSGSAATAVSSANTIRGRFADLVAVPSSLPTQYDNARFEPPADAVWARITVLEGEGSAAGKSPYTHRSVGLAVIDVFAPLGAGEKEAMTVADKTGDAFRCVTVDGILFRTPRLYTLGREGRWWRLQVRCPFSFDNVSS